MKEKLVSIIMGTYNGQNTIKKCIDSIIEQSYSNWEFIICDDCSTDDTWNILKEYEKIDSRIKPIKNEVNSRLAFSLNNCLSYSSGEYIARMDDDDICLTNRLEKQVEFLDSHPGYAVVGSGVSIFDGENVTGTRIPKELPNKKDVMYGPTFIHPSIMVRKETYDYLKGYTVSDRTKRGQDWDLWFRFFASGFVGYNIQEPLLIYHESKSDMKKRTIKTAWMYVRTAIYGYKQLKFPFYYYPIALKPMISAIIPSSIMKKYHSKKNEVNNG